MLKSGKHERGIPPVLLSVASRKKTKERVCLPDFFRGFDTFLMVVWVRALGTARGFVIS